MASSSALIVGRGSDYLRTELSQIFGDVAFLSSPDPAAYPGAVEECDMLVARSNDISAELLDRLPRLRLIQALTAGTDHITQLSNLPPSAHIAAAHGFHGPQMSELAMLFMLTFSRRFREVLDNQQQRRWERYEARVLSGSTVVIVGVGQIAEDLAIRCQAFGMHVAGVSASRTSAPGFDRLYPRTRLCEAAGQADYLVVLAPYDRQSHHLIDAQVLKAMKPGGVLINLSRGGLVDEEALLRALGDGTIAGAGLDVFDQEPLPGSSPFWGLPNVVVTPHIGGLSETYVQQVMPLLQHNLHAFLSGELERMHYVVDREAVR